MPRKSIARVLYPPAFQETTMSRKLKKAPPADKYIPSIEDRVIEARNAVALICAGVSATEDIGVSDAALGNAMLQAAQRAYDELAVLSELPTAILTAPAPDEHDCGQ